MYCPKCSQPQVSGDMRYCSRCGFPLATVAILLNHNGILPQVDGSKPSHPASRAKIATESIIMTIFSWAVGLGATLWFDAGGPFEIIAKLAAVLFFGLGLIGLLRFLYAFLFVKDQVPGIQRPQSPPEFISSDERTPQALPSPQQTPITDWTRRPNTREIVSQPSVTENTTRLLDDSDLVEKDQTTIK